MHVFNLFEAIRAGSTFWGVCAEALTKITLSLSFWQVIRILLIKLKNRRKQIQGVHDGEYKEMQQTTRIALVYIYIYTHTDTHTVLFFSIAFSSSGHSKTQICAFVLNVVCHTHTHTHTHTQV